MEFEFNPLTDEFDLVGISGGTVPGVLSFKGTYDASSNTFPSGTIKAGDIWVISVAGVLGGKNIQVGDYVLAVVDDPGQTSANRGTLNTNIDYEPVPVLRTITINGVTYDLSENRSRTVSSPGDSDQSILGVQIFS